MITVFNDCARLVCFDRNGAAMTPSFSYLEEPDVIGKFLYRLSRLDRAGRGYDASVEAASLENERFFRALHERHPQPRSAEAAGLRDAATAGWRVYKVGVDAPFSTDGTPVRRSSPLARHELLVGKPASVQGSLVGRGTRGFVAFDVTSQQVVFLKDSWRPDSEYIRSEFDNYMLIAESGIEGQYSIPTLLGGGDVKCNGVVQRTRTPTTRYHPFIHFRLVLKEVCRRLVDFRNSYQLLRAVTYAFGAHMMIWEACSLLHRDVSAGNILIHNPRDNEDPDSDHVVGLLADWDLAKTEEEMTSGGATQQRRSGTWPFMSARLQQFPEKPHDVADDLESFYHVFNWCALLYLPHKKSLKVEILAEYISRMYDFASPDNPELGHPDKLENMETGKPFVTMLELAPNIPHPLQLVLQNLASLFQLHYYHVCYPPGPPGLAPQLEMTPKERPQLDTAPSWEQYLEDVPPASVESRKDLPTTSTELRDPTMSPLRNHRKVLTCLWRAVRNGSAWPGADRIAAHRVV
ncbi:hypothetical protein L226DRAFT_494404 [Lentinus tigrinus ALCF2SS1-7]|nr:hypothetical protein L226DRAFT_494404 [Lentinus tigrinus ALCF2SS1-7]